MINPNKKDFHFLPMNFSNPSEKEKVQDPTPNLPLECKSKRNRFCQGRQKSLCASVLTEWNRQRKVIAKEDHEEKPRSVQFSLLSSVLFTH